MIQFFHVSKSYDGRQQAVHDISFRVNKGEFVFLTGPSGAGKTTLMKLILCAEFSDEGQILVAGRNVARISQGDIPALRRQIGVVFQDFKLIERKTVFENVALSLRIQRTPSDQIHRRTMSALKSVGIMQKHDKYPLQLSGGEQQRVAIARAIAKDPLILIADEPTGNLDYDVTQEIMGIIRDIHARGTTVLVATHDREMVSRLGKRILHIEEGRME